MKCFLPLVRFDDEGEGSELCLSRLANGQPNGDEPSELLAASSTWVRLKLKSPSPNKSTVRPSILRHELAPSMLRCSNLSSHPASIETLLEPFTEEPRSPFILGTKSASPTLQKRILLDSENPPYLLSSAWQVYKVRYQLWLGLIVTCLATNFLLVETNSFNLLKAE